MKHQYIILGSTFALLVALSGTSPVIALDLTNATIEKTPANATVIMENGMNISQPRTPLIVPPENLTANNLSDINISAR